MSFSSKSKKKIISSDGAIQDDCPHGRKVYPSSHREIIFHDEKLLIKPYSQVK